MTSRDREAIFKSRGRFHLRLLATSDLHGHIFSYDYYLDRPIAAIGLGLTARLIAIARAEAANCLVLDNGDFLQGNPLCDYVADRQRQDADSSNAIVAAMNAAGIEVAALGNHEFNYGLDYLSRALSRAAFPVVAANLRLRGGAAKRALGDLVRPFAIVERDLVDNDGRNRKIRIGVLGFLPPQTKVWDRDILADQVEVDDIVVAARQWVPKLRAAGADVIVALAHSGIGAAEHEYGMENAALPLAEIAGIDAIFAGHTHRIFPGDMFPPAAGIDPQHGTLNGKPAAMPGFWGSHLGIIDLALEPNGRHGWRVCAHSSALRPVAVTPGASTADIAPPPLRAVPEVLAAARDAHRQTLAYIRRPVGETQHPLHSYFSLLGHDRALSLIAEAKMTYLAELVRGGADAELPILATASPSKCGGLGGPKWYTNIPPGKITLRNIADLYLFANYFRAFRLNGAALAEWLERSAAIFRQITPGARDQMLIDSDMSATNFDVIFGLSYEIDLSQPRRYGADGRLVNPAARRIRNLRHRGRPISAEHEFLLATNSFRAAGGGNFPGAEAAHLNQVGPDMIRQILLRHLRRNSPVAPATGPIFRFRPLENTEVLFDTGPDALRHLSEIADFRPAPVGHDAAGFLRLRLDLAGSSGDSIHHFAEGIAPPSQSS